MTPYTLSKYDDQLPEGVNDYGNSVIDRMAAYARNQGIDVIDFREEMHNDGIDQYSLMYRTDHHWTTEAGVYAYGIYEKYIKEKTGCVMDDRISNAEHYQIENYKKWHLGSRGQRTGRYFAGIDDFKLYIPKFETTIQNDKGTIGSMQNMIYNMEPLQTKNVTSRYTYDNVLEESCGHYINLDCPNDIKVLMVGDSFSKAVNPFLLMGVSEMDFVSNEKKSVITPEYIESYDPDIVILQYYLYAGTQQTAYEWQGFE